jgi:hypothetical protein
MTANTDYMFYVFKVVKFHVTLSVLTDARCLMQLEVTIVSHYSTNMIYPYMNYDTNREHVTNVQKYH